MTGILTAAATAAMTSSWLQCFGRSSRVRPWTAIADTPQLSISCANWTVSLVYRYTTTGLYQLSEHVMYTAIIPHSATYCIVSDISGIARANVFPSLYFPLFYLLPSPFNFLSLSFPFPTSFPSRQTDKQLFRDWTALHSMQHSNKWFPSNPKSDENFKTWNSILKQCTLLLIKM